MDVKFFDDLKGNMPARMGLLAAGAAMADPRSTGGNFGTALNQGVQSGLNTYLPMMQWQQNKKDQKEDRDWRKQQDVMRNVLAERTFKLRKATAESELDNREQAMNLRRAQFGLSQKKYQAELEAMQQQQAFAGQLSGYAANGMPTQAAGQSPMRINPATGQPFGDEPQTRPMNESDFARISAGYLASGGNASTINALKGQFSATDPNSPNYNYSRARAADTEVQAQGLVDAGIYKTMAEARNAIRSNMDIGNMIRANQMTEMMRKQK